ncbi:MAG: response regulator [Nitrospiraceae bacterium]
MSITAEKPGVAASIQSGTILLVEDQKQVRDVTRQMLQEQGYTVLFAGDAEAALKVCRLHTGKIDLLVSDVVMPGTNGLALAERIRTVRPRIRILLYSGLLPDNAVVGKMRPDADFLPKPFTQDRLVEKVHEILQPTA